MKFFFDDKKKFQTILLKLSFTSVRETRWPIRIVDKQQGGSIGGGRSSDADTRFDEKTYSWTLFP